MKGGGFFIDFGKIKKQLNKNMQALQGSQGESRSDTHLLLGLEKELADSQNKKGVKEEKELRDLVKIMSQKLR